jgi:hypothetical protein
MTVTGTSAAGILALAAVLACLTGCSTNEETVESDFEASNGGTRASVAVPDGEDASIGTYVLSIAAESVQGARGGRQTITGERDGTLTGLWVEDITGDGEPEVVVAIAAAGSGSYGSCHVYSDSGGRFDRVELSPLTDEQRAGFMGQDVFEVVDGVLYRTFPVYVSGDPNARPSGGLLGYRYDFGTAAWVEP